MPRSAGGAPRALLTQLLFPPTHPSFTPSGMPLLPFLQIREPTGELKGTFLSISCPYRRRRSQEKALSFSKGCELSITLPFLYKKNSIMTRQWNPIKASSVMKG